MCLQVPYVIEETMEDNSSVLTYGSCAMDDNGFGIFVDKILQFLGEATVEKIKKSEDLDRYYQGVGVYIFGDKMWKAKIFMQQWEDACIYPKVLFRELERRRNEKADAVLREIYGTLIYVLLLLYVASFVIYG